MASNKWFYLEDSFCDLLVEFGIYFYEEDLEG